MKLLILTKNYKPSTIPDAKRFSGIAEYLAQQGHIITVITESKSESLNGVTVLKTRQIGRDSLGMLERLVNHTSFMIQSIFRSIKVKEIDVVISTSPPLFNLIAGRWISKIKKTKYIIDLRDIWPDVFEQTNILTKSSLVYRIFARVAKIAYKKADIIAVVTPGKKELISSEFPQYKEKIHLLSNGFNKEILEYEDDANIKSSFSSEFNVVYTGKIGLAQDLSSFLQLAKDQLSNDSVMFHIFGSGREKDKVIEYIAEEGLKNVKFYGYRSEKEIATALRYAQLSYVSLSNDRLIDSVPSKLYEALAFGCPVLLSAVGDSANLVNKLKYGKVSVPNSYEELVADFRYIFENYAIFVNRKEEVMSFMLKNYSREVTASKYNEIIKMLCEKDGN